MSRSANKVNARLLGRRALIESGHNRALRLYRRPIGDDERVIINPPVVSFDQASAAAWGTALGGRRRIAGQLWVTDRRLALAARSNVTQEWAWGEFDDVRMLPQALGVVAFTGQMAVVLQQAAPDSPAFSTPLTPWVRWLTVEAVFAWSRGRLDEWYADLPHRLAAAG